MHKIIGKAVAVRSWMSKYLLSLWFLLILVVGVTCVFLIKPLYGSDEIVHFPRAYQVSEGQLSVQHLSGYDYGGYLPAQIQAMNDGFREQVQSNSPDLERLQQLESQYNREKLRTVTRKPLSFTSAGVYSPWSYLPAAIGVKIARFLDLPLLWYIYLARLMCLIVWATCTYLALRLLPTGKLFLAAVALLPTTIVQAATIGMDGVVNGLSWLLIAITLRALWTKKITTRALVAAAALSLLLATTKQGYVLLAALPLIIPVHYYPSKLRRYGKLGRSAFGLVLFVASIWYIKTTLPIASILHFIQRPGLYVDAQEQLLYVLANPLTTMGRILLQPFTLGYAGIYAGLVGVLTNKLIYLPTAVMVLLYGGLTAAFMGAHPLGLEKRYAKQAKLTGLAIMLGTFLLINLALYVSFTQVGFNRVEGIQGRYFLPVLPLLLLFRGGLPPLVTWRNYLVLIAGICLGLGLISTILLLL